MEQDAEQKGKMIEDIEEEIKRGGVWVHGKWIPQKSETNTKETGMIRTGARKRHLTDIMLTEKERALLNENKHVYKSVNGKGYNLFVVSCNPLLNKKLKLEEELRKVNMELSGKKPKAVKVKRKYTLRDKTFWTSKRNRPHQHPASTTPQSQGVLHLG